MLECPYPLPCLGHSATYALAARAGFVTSRAQALLVPAPAVRQLWGRRSCAAGISSCTLSVQSGTDRHAADLNPVLVDWDMEGLELMVPKLFVILREVGFLLLWKGCCSLFLCASHHAEPGSAVPVAGGPWGWKERGWRGRSGGCEKWGEQAY